MARPRPRSAALSTIAACALVLQALAAPGQSPSRIVPRPIVIIGGTIVDGTGAPARRNDAIVVQDGRMKAIGLAASKRAPKDARMIDASDKWIVPGLIDAAVHLFQTGGADARPDLIAAPEGRSYAANLADIKRAPAPYLRAYVCAGITTVLNIGGPAWTFALREGRADDGLSPRIATTGPWIAPGAPAAMMVPGDEAYLVAGETAGIGMLMDRLAKEGPDLLAIRLESEPAGHETAADFLQRAVTEAHAKKQRVIVETVSLPQLRAAVGAGADAVVSRVAQEIPGELVSAMVKQQIVVIPALAASESARRMLAGNATLEDIESRCAPAATAETLTKSSPDSTAASGAATAAAGERRNLQRLAAAGVAIVAGSGAGEPGALHGTSLHRSLAAMADAGMDPMRILLSATRDAARLLGRATETGQIKEGFAADLVLLDADPIADIRNARKVSLVIRRGAIYER